MRLALAAALLAFAQSLAVDEHRAVKVRALPAMRNVDRIGVNLGHWTSWGAEQLSANVLKNPGLEGNLDGAIVVVDECGVGYFRDDTEWVARAAGFWDGASFTVLTGEAAGGSGMVQHSSIEAGRMRFETGINLRGLSRGDAVSVRIARDGVLPGQWWLDSSKAAGDDKERRPGTKGRQSLRLEGGATGAIARSYLDAIGDRAGKLLPLDGEWVFSIWAKAEGQFSKMRVRLHRTGQLPFLDAEIQLEANWQLYEWRFRPMDSGPAGTIELALFTDPESKVWLDDAALHSSEDGSDGFRRAVVETLQGLNPGYLRDWQGQLGDSFANRTAPAEARRTVRYRPENGTEFLYGLPEFLTLAQQVGAQPWIVLAPTMTLPEWRTAGRFLAHELRNRGFREILVEFGNENWNAIFRPAGIRDPKSLGHAASAAFEALRSGAESDERIRPILGGQFYNAGQLEAVLAASEPSTLLAVAPYWGFTLNQPADLFPAGIEEGMRRLMTQRETAVYEVNAHSLSGGMATAQRNEWMESEASGGAMMWNLLGMLRAGVRRVCVYVLSGFDTPGDDPGSLVRLFGITRDLAQPNRFRPSGEAVVALNEALQGDLYTVEGDEGALRVVALRSATAWTIVVASKSPRKETIRVRLPRGEVLGIDVPAFGWRIAKKEMNPHDR